MDFKTNTSSFSSPSARQDFAALLAGLVGEPQRPFEAYCATPGDDTHWVVDSNNNWRVAFPPAEPNCARVLYRYQCAAVPEEEALALRLQAVRSDIVTE